MLLGIELFPRDKVQCLNNVLELEKEGIHVKGYEVQVQEGDTEKDVMEAVKFLNDNFEFKFRGLSPPQPNYPGAGFLKWNHLAKKLKFDYTVLDAAVDSKDFKDLSVPVKSTIAKAEAAVYLKNVHLEEDSVGAGSLTETILLHDKLALNLSALIYNWQFKRRMNVSPEDQIEKAFEDIKVVHVADFVSEQTEAPVNGGSTIFKELMTQITTKKSLMIIAKPKDAFADGGKSQKETCRQLWSQWGKVSK
ncbi:MAG: hypothetical protein GOU98_04600 [Candidatus Altiarchaeota archaeon]|nr:hypothetical protein [Candidatus Altiarchaeota archaeon]